MKKNLNEKCKTCNHTLKLHKKDKKDEGKCKVKDCKCDKFEYVWYEVKLPTKGHKKGDQAWVKGKDGIKSYKRMKENSERYTKMFKLKVVYSSKNDTFSVRYGRRPVHHKVEIDFLGKGDVRFLCLKGNVVTGIEIDNLSKIMKRFDCDKNKKFIKEIHDNYEKHKKDKKPFFKNNKKLWPDFCHASKYDLFDIYWVTKPVKASITINLIYTDDVVLDYTEDGDIVGIEFLEFDSVLKKFDIDKKNKKQKI